MASAKDLDVTYKLLEANDWNTAIVAGELGLSRRTIQERAQAIKLSLVADKFPVLPGRSILWDSDGSVKQAWSKGDSKGWITAEEISSQVHTAFKDYKSVKPIKVGKFLEDHMACYPLPDLHMGLRSWAPETGQDFDLSIAGDRYRGAIDALSQTVPNTQKALVLGLGDLLHADNYHYGTTNPNTHHVVDADGRYPKMLLESCEIVIHAVERARQKAEEVEVVILRGNHDGASAIGVQIALHYRYRDDPSVQVYMGSEPHWCGQFGKNMIFATHGDKLKFGGVVGYCASKYHKMWGDTEFRHAYTGHLHTERVKEVPGMTVEILQSPSAPDAWTNEMGYNSGRSMQARVIHETRGEIAKYKEPV